MHHWYEIVNGEIGVRLEMSTISKTGVGVGKNFDLVVWVGFGVGNICNT